MRLIAPAALRGLGQPRGSLAASWPAAKVGRSAPGPSILLSGSHAQAEGTAIGTTIGTLSVVGTALGTYTFTETADPDSAFTLTGATVKNGIVFDYETKTSYSVTYQGNSDNGTDPVLTATFVISVTNVVEVPVNSAAPVITGTAAVGSVLSVSTGTWTDMAAGTFAYQWKSAGTNIGGATASSFTPLDAQAGTAITCDITATNSAGSATATSAATVAVTEAPSNTVAPSIGGSATVGNVLTVTPGTWRGYPAPSLTYQEYRDGVPIGGATATNYTTVTADLGASITVIETATNSTGAVAATSSSFGPITAGASSSFGGETYQLLLAA